MSNPKTTNDPISEYLKWKQQGEELRAGARQAMETRFRELLMEAARLAQEYRADFGAPLKPPPVVTAFRFKSGARPKPKRAAAPKPEPAPAPPPPKTDRKTAGLRKRLETARKRLEAAKAAGAPTKALEDRIYEIEDDLRLSAES